MTIQCMGRWIIEWSKAKKLASHFWPKITIEVSYMGYLVDRGQSQTFPWKKNLTTLFVSKNLYHNVMGQNVRIKFLLEFGLEFVSLLITN